MKIQFVSGFGPIVRDIKAGRTFYGDALGIAFEGGEGQGYAYTEQLEGVKHLGLWPLSAAAEACFGTSEWPSDIPQPQATIEFDLESAEAVTEGVEELEAKGYRLLHRTRTEPWNQTLARLLSPEGLLVGIAYTPGHHAADQSAM
jgi:catechol 2,3-dioxygenase-like lactoylglutathione lyase family enzyme